MPERPSPLRLPPNPCARPEYPAISRRLEETGTVSLLFLVDVMLVLLIIFLITIPVVTHTVPVSLPKETSVSTRTKPENVNLSVDRDGQVFWNRSPSQALMDTKF